VKLYLEPRRRETDRGERRGEGGGEREEEKGRRGRDRKRERERRGEGGRKERRGRERRREGERISVFFYLQNSVLCLSGDSHENSTENSLDKIKVTGGLQGLRLPAWSRLASTGMAQARAAAETDGAHSDEGVVAWKPGPDNTQAVLSGFNNPGLIEAIWIWIWE